MYDIIVLLFCFQIKHFVCDYPLQIWPYMFKNKGTYGHSGGLLHAGVQGFGTFIVLSIFTPFIFTAMCMGVLDFITHYHIDYCKMKINNVYKLDPNKSSLFWILLGLDQLFHQVTYLYIISLL
jgi:hypothetical protein